MAAPSPSSISILGRLRADPRDPKGWHDFLDRYGPVIRRWCIAQGVKGADADDLTQDIIAKFLETAAHRHDRAAAGEAVRVVFDLEHGIRGLLKTMTHHAVVELRSGRRRHNEVLEELSAVRLADAERDLRERMEREHQLELLEKAEAKVRLQVEERTWQVYWLTYHEGVSPEEAAARLGMSMSAVYTARLRVRERVEREVRRLEAQDDGAGSSAP